MPKGYPTLTSEQKREIIQRVKEKGESVADLARDYGAKPKTIYKVLQKTVVGPNTMLEIARLKRENKALVSIIGRLVADQKTGGKNRIWANW